MSAHIHEAVTSGDPKNKMKMEKFQAPHVPASILKPFVPYITPCSSEDDNVSSPDYRLTGRPWRASPKSKEKIRICSIKS